MSQAEANKERLLESTVMALQEKECHGNHKCENTGSRDAVLLVFTVAPSNKSIGGVISE